jgi:hypothetical protein
VLHCAVCPQVRKEIMVQAKDLKEERKSRSISSAGRIWAPKEYFTSSTGLGDTKSRCQQADVDLARRSLKCRNNCPFSVGTYPAFESTSIWRSTHVLLKIFPSRTFAEHPTVTGAGARPKTTCRRPERERSVSVAERARDQYIVAEETAKTFAGANASSDTQGCSRRM